MTQLLYFLQKHVSKRSAINRQLNLDNWNRHLEVIKTVSCGRTVFEFGAGKSLIQNLYLAPYVDSQIVVDLNRMIDLNLVDAARCKLDDITDNDYKIPITSAQDLNSYGIKYEAPFDATSTDFESGYIDICISTNTLEHIPPYSIKCIFVEIHRILKSEGFISVIVDYSDHYSHTDTTISPLNFLHFSDEEWQKYNHNCHFQNRMRHYDYITLFGECGFKIVKESLEFGEFEIDENLKTKFRNCCDSWSAISAHFVLQKK